MISTQRFVALAVSALSVVAVTLGVLLPASPATAAAVSSSPALAASVAPVLSASNPAFNAGNIVSDAVFYDSSSMSEGQIASFLQQKVPNCQSGYTCLKDFRQSTSTRAADAYCPASYQGEGSESAARIVFKVAQACGINPQALLATLQKEQGLVTHTWPSDWRYTIAMGQGCPDTAACDTRYYGFQNQVYGAARQFKIYAEGKYFTWYAPGKTWNVLFNPNKSCGTAPVYIANKATAGLYYYTPYQPNAAALAAGFGTGDSCSSYGNRNFFNYFTQWFGSTQSSAGPIVQAAGDPAVYLVSDGVRHHVSTPRDLTALSSRLGGVTSVSSNYLANLPNGAPVTRYVHDPRTGTLYLLEADGTRHRFPDAATIAAFGYRFDSYVNLEGSLIDSFTQGSDVGPVIRSESSPEVYYLDAGTKRYIPSPDVLGQLASFTGYVASVDAAAAAKLPTGSVYLLPWTMVHERGKPSVYLTIGRDTLVPTPSLDLAREFGATSVVSLGAGALTGWKESAAVLSPFLDCGGSTYMASGGSLVRITGKVTDMFTSVPLTAAQCAGRPISSTVVAKPFFLQSPRGEVYRASEGRLQYISSPEELNTLAGGPIRVVNVGAGTIGTFAQLRPTLAGGTAVQFRGDGRVLIWDGATLRHVETLAALHRLYDGITPPITTLPAITEPSFPTGQPIR